jgi:hypothetical protein
MTPLDPTVESWRRKFEQAQAHYETFDAAAKRFGESNPCTFGQQLDPQTSEYVIWIETVAPVPVEIMLTIGDCLQNFRAVLDHFVWHIAVFEWQKAHPGSDPPTRTMFPIFRDPEKYRNESGRQIAALPPDMQTVIETLQPYDTPDRNWLYPLWVLQELSVIDKHRSIALAAISTPGGLLQVRTDTFTAVSTQDVGIVRPNAEVGRFPETLLGDIRAINPEMDVQFFLPLEVAFNDPRVTFPPGWSNAVQINLLSIGDRINRVIRRLKEFSPYQLDWPV